MKNQTVEESADQPRIDRLLVQVTDMNVHSANLADKIDFKSKRRKQSQGKGPSSSGAETSSKMQILTELKKLTAQELYSCSNAVPMLHDTAVELCIEKRSKTFGGETAETETANEGDSKKNIPASESFHSFVMDLDQVWPQTLFFSVSFL